VSNSSLIDKTAKLGIKSKLSVPMSAQEYEFESFEFDPDQLVRMQNEVKKWFTAT